MGVSNAVEGTLSGRERQTVWAAMAMVWPTQLESRLTAILDPRRRRGGLGRKPAAVALLAAIFVLVPLATLPFGARTTGSTVSASEPIGRGDRTDDPAARMVASGRVLDPSGKPAADAAVMVIVRGKQDPRPMFTRAMYPMTEHEGRSDKSGRFQIELPRTSSARHELIVTALAPGHALGWTELDPDALAPTADVTLRPELVIRGRVFDVQGQAVRGVAIRVERLVRSVHGVIVGVGIVRRPDCDERPWRDLPAWPGPATSDDQGRFTLRGLGRGPTFVLVVEDPRYAPSSIAIQTEETTDVSRVGAQETLIKVGPGNEPEPISITLLPRRTVAGVVTYADTGAPVPRAAIMIGTLQYEADAQGRFRAAVPGVGVHYYRSLVQAQSPDGPPYLIAEKQIEWPSAVVEQSVNIALKRGVVIRGKVIEEGTGRGVAGAMVRFTPYTLGRGPSYDVSIAAATGPDGSYRVAAAPGPGHLVVQAPDDDYVLHELGGYGGPLEVQPGRSRFYAHAYRTLDLKPGAAEQEVNVTLRRGMAIHGRAIDPEGRPIQDGWVVSHVTVSSGLLNGWKLWSLTAGNNRIQVRDGRFALHGIDPDVETPAYFLEPRRKLGATVRFSGKATAKLLFTVRLEPCGAARARLIDADGKPVARYPASRASSMIVTPGPPSQPAAGPNEPAGGLLFADELSVVRLDPVNYGADFQSDAGGRLTFPSLVPGALYRIVDRTPTPAGLVPRILKEFTVQPGEILELGDLVITPRR